MPTSKDVIRHAPMRGPAPRSAMLCWANGGATTKRPTARASASAAIFSFVDICRQFLFYRDGIQPVRPIPVNPA